MRIAYLVTQYPPHVTAGLGRYAEAIVPLLAAHRIDVLSVNPGDLPAQSVTDYNLGPVTVHRPQGRILRGLMRRYRPVRTRSLGFAILALNVIVANVRCVFLARKLALSEPFDLIAVHETTNAVAGLACARLLRAPVIVHVHNTEFSLAPTKEVIDPFRIFARLELKLATVAHWVVVPTPELAQQLEDGGWDPAKTIVIPHGNPLESIDPVAFAAEDIQALRDMLMVSPNAQVILFVGRIESVKGVYTLVEAMGHVARRHHNTVLVILGEGENARLVRTVEAEGISDKTVLIDYWIDRNDLPLWYLMADICCFPSLFEPFGLVAVEAMSLGRPTVLGPGFSSIFAGESDAPAARIVTTDNPLALADALSELLANDDEQTCRGKNGRALVARSFTWDVAARKTEELYVSAIESARRDKRRC